MRPSRIKAKLARQQPVLVTSISFSDPSIFELASLMGFDGIWLDLEHHAHSVEAANNYIRAARVGVSDVIARPGKGEFMRMGRMLEAGAKGIMYPRCDDAVEAAEVVRWSKFAPVGERGIDTANPDAPYCSMPLKEYVAMANRETFVVIQLEQASAVDQVELIAAVPGIDVLMLGPADFSVLGGIAGQFDHPLIGDAKKRIAAAAKDAGIYWGTTCGTSQHIEESLEMGARFICHGADILMVKRGLEQMRENCLKLGFAFDDLDNEKRITL
ncbi:MAG: aldolase/citrate lyase family protein [Planctomycetota bacterium]|nr:aldolase/citrate lyase family protein [Planctomycetota bacterium]